TFALSLVEPYFFFCCGVTPTRSAFECNRTESPPVLTTEANTAPSPGTRENLMKRSLLIVLLCATAALAQRNAGSLKGSVTDEFGGVIVGATVVATDANGATKTATTTNDGNFTLSGLAPGKYDVKVSAQGFANFENIEIEVTAGAAQKFDVTLKVTIEQQKVTVSADTNGVNTEPDSNVGAIVLKGTDLESLPDDPDDLAA